MSKVIYISSNEVNDIFKIASTGEFVSFPRSMAMTCEDVELHYNL